MIGEATSASHDEAISGALEAQAGVSMKKSAVRRADRAREPQALTSVQDASYVVARVTSVLVMSHRTAALITPR
jgi:hypothetical protein